jgi:hypothetical protein
MDIDVKLTTVVGAMIVIVIGILAISHIDMSSVQCLNSYQLNFSSNPADGDGLIVDGVIFEFDSGDGVTNGTVPVVIESDYNETSLNLKNAIKQSASYGVA